MSRKNPLDGGFFRAQTKEFDTLLLVMPLAAGLFAGSLVGLFSFFLRGAFFGKRPAAATASVGVRVGNLVVRRGFHITHDGHLNKFYRLRIGPTSQDGKTRFAKCREHMI